MLIVRRPTRWFALLALALLLATTGRPLPSRADVAPASSDAAVGNLLLNGDFSSGFSAWWATASVNASVVDGELHAAVLNGGSNPWDAIIGQNNLPLQQGQRYTVRFDARSSEPVSVIAKLQKESAPYTTYWQASVSLSGTSQRFEYAFTSDFSDPAAAIQFQMGGLGTPTIYLDNVEVVGPRTTAPGPELLVKNGDFASGLDPWWTAGAISPDFGGVCLALTHGGANPWDAILGQSNIAVEQGQSYTLSFSARASSLVPISVNVQQAGPPYAAYLGQRITLSTARQDFVFSFTPWETNPAAALQFQMGGSGTPTICLYDVVLESDAGNLVLNGAFDGSMDPWWLAGGARTELGGVCLAITNGGANPWDAILGQNGVRITAGKTYRLSFEASASTAAPITVNVQQAGPPYGAYFSQRAALDTATQRFSSIFTASGDDQAASIQFQLGGVGSPTICLNHVELVQVPTGVRLNQVGYLPYATKRATVLHPATTPLSWELRDAGGVAVLSGITSVFGNDSASGDFVHSADFSAYTTAGSGYTLKVGADVSHAFDIGKHVYRSLKYDALAYFYHNRSGIAIEMPYAGDPKWTRPAGHIGVSPNQGDTSVTCFKGRDVEQQPWAGCDYALNVTRGWYDAGDHGKYVVNGGISVWTLLNLFERTQQLGHPGGLQAFADGKLRIPENANGIPDLLDEARWELEFLLAMQVPAGQPLAGMVHHKLHDENWTGLPLPPHANPQPRWLYPPSTAATLNMAATAAQCARIWQRYDAAFAQRCLQAAETAWAAALAHPDHYARNNFTGGGPYDDTRVSDEFYWAAAELFISTGKQEYRSYLTGSPHFSAALVLPGTLTSMSWGDTAALGSISLAVVPNGLSASERATLRARIVEAADAYLAAIDSEGYRTPFKPESSGYPWGSNSFVLNNMIIMALAHDLTGQPGYLNGVSESMDYLLGRNPMDQSYVSGYGERPLQHPHHRFWADQKDASYPPPHPGAVSGGPNSALQDPYAGPRLAGCAPQKCFVDHIDSWSTNEITINWNAPLAWVTTFLDEQQSPHTQR